ncbi:MAG TPA: DUF4190 domain-containing protein [Bellilinea sp.]
MTDETVLPPSLEPELLPPPVTPAAPTERGWAAITSLVLGLINLLTWCIPICGGPLAIAGVIFGFLGLKSSNRGFALAGIILNAIGIALSIIATVVFIAAFTSGWFQNIDPNQFYQP